MKPEDMDALLENEREWRRYMIERIETISAELGAVKTDSFVTKVVGGSLFALALVWLEWKLGH